MKVLGLKEIPESASNMDFKDDIQDNLTLQDVRLSTCRFKRCGIRDARFTNSSITQSLFEDCYMRKGHFANVQFTGTTFRNCNLERASFQGCDFRFSTFVNTRLNRNEIIACLPIESNLRRDLARNLRKNFEALGDKESADVFMKIEIQANEDELLSIFRRATEYYKKRYSPVEQLNAGLEFLSSKTSGMVWGYGHRVTRLLISFVVVALVLAAVTFLGNVKFSVAGNPPGRSLLFWEAVYQVFSETLGGAGTGLFPLFWDGMLLQLGERFIGTLFLALLAAAAYRRITR
jgi:hypothetical protein